MPSAKAPGGFRLIDPDQTINLLADLSGFTSKGGLTAFAGGGRTNATHLRNGMNRITVCATNADSVILPPAKYGSVVIVKNNGAADATVYAQGSDTINGTAGATGVTQADPLSALYFCVTDGVWDRILSA